MTTTKKQAPSWRFWFLSSLLAIGMLGILLRVIDLTLFDQAFLQKQGNARSLRTLTLPAHRGLILDRNNNPLAISSPVTSIWVNPKAFHATPNQLKSLAALLEISPNELSARIQKNQKREFLYLKRQLPPHFADDIKPLKIAGLHSQQEFRRFYPEGEATAHLLGSTNIDDRGQEGLELSYNPWLEGIPGLQRVAKDRLGQVIDQFELIRPPKPGRALQLTIDRRLQYLAYHSLEEGVKKYQAEAGTVIILDPRSNEILALTNYPSFNPNVRTAAGPEHRNRAITDVFEPASTIKTFSVANALSSGKFTPHSIVSTEPGWMMVEGKRVMDVHNKGTLNLTEVLKYSSNVGITKVTLSLPSNSLWNTLHKVGFGETSELNLPGERNGSLEKHFVWHPFTLATLSFGYGLDITALQLAQAYSIIANDGKKLPLHLFVSPEKTNGKTVFTPAVAASLRQMLSTVVEKGGTATLAQVPGYQVAGKTGTAKRVGSQGYLKHSYNSSFVGMLPADHPKLLVVVVLYNLSSNVYYAGSTAAPLFANIAGESARLLAIPSQV